MSKKKDKDELLARLKAALKKGSSTEMGNLLLEEIGKKAKQEKVESDVITVSIYRREDIEEGSWAFLAKPIQELTFKKGEEGMAVDALKAYEGDDFHISVSLSNISSEALSGVQISPYFEFISSNAPVDIMLSGTKSDYIGEA